MQSESNVKRLGKIFKATKAVSDLLSERDNFKKKNEETLKLFSDYGLK